MLMHHRCIVRVIRPCASVNKMPNERKQCYRLRMISNRVVTLLSRTGNRTLPPSLTQHACSCRDDWSTQSFGLSESADPSSAHCGHSHTFTHHMYIWWFCKRQCDKHLRKNMWKQDINLRIRVKTKFSRTRLIQIKQEVSQTHFLFIIF